MKLPPRRVLRSIVEDAISDREEFDDEMVRDETKAIIARYREFLPRLADSAPPLSKEDHDLLVTACRHARIWREGYVESWLGTGEKRIILEARQDVDRVTRTEDALGVVRHWLNGGPEPEGMSSITVFELSKRIKAQGQGQGWMTMDGKPLGSI